MDLDPGADDITGPLIEPILIVIMGVVIGGMIISLYLPMFDVITTTA